MQQAIELYKQGNIPAAKDRCQQLLSKNPANISALNLFGALENEAGDYNTALKYLKTALSHKPSEISIYINKNYIQNHYNKGLSTLLNRGAALNSKGILAEQL